MADLATTDRSTLSTEYVAGGTGLWSRTALRTLPAAIDDVTQDFGDDLYDRMDLDPVVHANKNVLKVAIIEEGRDGPQRGRAERAQGSDARESSFPVFPLEPRDQTGKPRGGVRLGRRGARRDRRRRRLGAARR